MLAVRFEGKRVVVDERPAPSGAGVLVRVRSCGICGSDLSILDSGFPVSGTPGHEIRLVVDGRLPVAPPPAVAPEPVVVAAAPAADAAKPAAAPVAPVAPVAPAVAPAAETAPPACVAFGGLSAEQAAELSARIAKAGSGFRLTENRGGAPSSWWVHSSR